MTCSPTVPSTWAGAWERRTAFLGSPGGRCKSRFGRRTSHIRTNTQPSVLSPLLYLPHDPVGFEWRSRIVCRTTLGRKGIRRSRRIARDHRSRCDTRSRYVCRSVKDKTKKIGWHVKHDTKRSPASRARVLVPINYSLFYSARTSWQLSPKNPGKHSHLAVTVSNTPKPLQNAVGADASSQNRPCHPRVHAQRPCERKVCMKPPARQVPCPEQGVPPADATQSCKGAGRSSFGATATAALPQAGPLNPGKQTHLLGSPRRQRPWS